MPARAMSDSTIPVKPQPPENYDCCGGGCADCELRLYYQRLAEWAIRTKSECLEGHSIPNRGRTGMSAPAVEDDLTSRQDDPHLSN